MWKHACAVFFRTHRGKASSKSKKIARSNRFECVRASTHIVPMWDASCVPAVGPISARVVGNGEVDVDDQDAYVFNSCLLDETIIPIAAQAAPRDSARVRVAQPWADAQSGTAFWPRVGSEVLVLFMQNDPDKPIVVANMFDAQHAPVRSPAQEICPTTRRYTASGRRKSAAWAMASCNSMIRLHRQRPNYPPNTAKLSSIRAGLAILATKVHRKSGVKASNFAPIYPRFEPHEGCCFRRRPQQCKRARPRSSGIDRSIGTGSVYRKEAELSSTHDAYETDTGLQEKLTKGIRVGRRRRAAAIGVTAPDGIAISSPENVLAVAGGNVESVAAQDVNLSAGRRILMRAAQDYRHSPKPG